MCSNAATLPSFRHHDLSYNGIFVCLDPEARLLNPQVLLLHRYRTPPTMQHIQKSVQDLPREVMSTRTLIIHRHNRFPPLRRRWQCPANYHFPLYQFRYPENPHCIEVCEDLPLSVSFLSSFLAFSLVFPPFVPPRVALVVAWLRSFPPVQDFLAMEEELVLLFLAY